MYFIYTCLSVPGHVFLALLFLLLPDRRRKYLPSIRQRCGFNLPTPTPPDRFCIWVHTVSMGEFLAARPLIQSLCRRYPQARIVISTITLTGNALARKHFPSLEVFFFPIDWAGIIRRFLLRLKPGLFVCVETEIWPNFFRLAHRAGCRLVLVNGRISPKSFRNYRRIRFFFRRIAAHVDLFLMQSPDNAQRIGQLGVAPEKIITTGNLKYDLSLETDAALQRTLEAIRSNLGLSEEVFTLVCGSSMPGEEPLITDLFSFLRHSGIPCRLILAPRHPERFDEVAGHLQALPFPFLRRSRLTSGESSRTADILLLDSIGELAHVYRLADLVFIGGSLANYGGHNILEPAFLGKAVVFGPHMRNFQDIANTFLAAKGAVQVRNSEELKQTVLRLAGDSAGRKALGERAAAIMRENGGALQRTLQHIDRLAGGRSPRGTNP